MEATRSRRTYREMVLSVFSGEHPGHRLVLGISDELPPDGDVERVRLIGGLVRHVF